ncbi:MAG: hypothetical protein J6S67_00815 [Methanobrevibacter sp.]|nr:hypothetical protein [Methanobrevibacter sp.]
MIATLVNDWYMTTDTGGSMGTTDTSNITAYQKHNAEKVYNYFSALGWSLSAIAGMLGNMQVESWLSPALIQGTHRSQLPNSASSLSDVPNSVMINFYGTSGYGVGLVQWDGYTSTAPAGQKLVSFAMRYSLNWYDGDTQLFRIRREQETNIQWQSRVINGTRWYWNNYVTNTQTPEVSARIWMVCYEVADTGTSSRRQENARYWYDYFSSTPPVPPTPTPDDWIDGSTFASLALAYDPDITGVQIPYSQMDCIGFVNTVWQDIPVVSQNGYSLTNGTNSIWRSSRTFPTESPIGQNPTPELWVKDTIGNVEINYGAIPTGALLFHQISEAGPPAIPPQYAGDGIGNFVHVGIYCGNNEVMQSGGQDSGAIPGGGVHKSTYDPTAWNYVAFVCYVDPSGDIPPEPPLPPAYDIVTFLTLWYSNKKKGVKKIVRKF